MEELAGVTAMEAKVAEVTVRFTAGLTMPCVFPGAPPARRKGEPFAWANWRRSWVLIQKNGDGVIRLVEDREILRADETEIGR